MGLFGKKKEPTTSLDFRAVNRMDRENFFQLLKQQGWIEVENAFEFDKNWDVERIRKSAKVYASRIGAEMLIEINDPSFSSNRYNDLVYYVFRRGGPPQPGSAYQTQGSAAQQSSYHRQSGQGGQMQYPGYPQGNQPSGWQQQQAAYPQNAYDPRGQVAAPPQFPASSSPAAPTGKKHKKGAKELYLQSTYSTYREALMDCLSNISKMLCMEPCPLPFMDNKEFIGRSVFLAKAGYNYMGVRMMDLVIVNPETDVYHILGNEGHDPTARRVLYMRDDLVLIKTEGLPRFDLMPDYDNLEDAQKSDIAKALFAFLERYLPKI